MEKITNVLKDVSNDRDNLQNQIHTLQDSLENAKNDLGDKIHAEKADITHTYQQMGEYFRLV